MARFYAYTKPEPADLEAPTTGPVRDTEDFFDYKTKDQPSLLPIDREEYGNKSPEIASKAKHRKLREGSWEYMRANSVVVEDEGITEIGLSHWGDERQEAASIYARGGDLKDYAKSKEIDEPYNPELEDLREQETTLRLYIDGESGRDLGEAELEEFAEQLEQVQAEIEDLAGGIPWVDRGSKATLELITMQAKLWSGVDNAVLRNAPKTKEDIKVFRSVVLDTEDSDHKRILSKLKAGEEFSDKSALSTSLDWSFASQFGDSISTSLDWGKSPLRVVFEIDVPKGTRGLFGGSPDFQDLEKEFTFNPGAKFDIIKTTKIVGRRVGFCVHRWYGYRQCW